MRYTAPQLYLLQEGELYGHYVEAGGYSGDQPIDNLIQAVQSSFIDWDLQNPKFIKLFKQHFPHGDSWVEEMGGIQNILLDLLDTGISQQSKALLKVLIRKTKETGGVIESGIMDVELDEWLDLSVRSRLIVVERLNIDTVEKLVNIPKHELVKSRNIGRVTCTELSRRLTELLAEWDNFSSIALNPNANSAAKLKFLRDLSSHTMAGGSRYIIAPDNALDCIKGKVTQEERNKIQEWIDSGVHAPAIQPPPPPP
jgi:hypothetical protein